MPKKYQIPSKTINTLIPISFSLSKADAKSFFVSLNKLEKFVSGGLRFAGAYQGLCWLKKKRCKCGIQCEKVPHKDHVRCFRNPKTKERVLTSHPYFGQSPCTYEQLVADSQEFAERHGLTVRVSMDSWYYPGRTALVEFRVKAA